MTSRIINSLIAIDQLANGIAGGWPDETLSSRCWRLRVCQPYKTLRPIIDTLFWFDPDHCQASFTSERLRLQSPPEERV